MIKLMKTMLLIAITAVVVLSSCSQDVMVEDVIVKTEPRQEIEFHLDMQSRATDRTMANLDTIWVYADDGLEEVFPVTPFIKDSFGRFLPEEKMYWPDGKDKINFTAFWPNPTVLKISTSPGQVILDHETLKTADKHYDIISATTTVDKLNSGKGIPLSFSHVLAQIDFKAKIGDEAEHRVEVYGIAIVNTMRMGLYNFGTKKWSSIKSEYALYAAPEDIMTVSEQPRSMTDKTGPFYTIPQSIQFNIFDSPNPVTNKVNLVVYGKVYDDTGNVIFPLPEWRGTDLAVRFTDEGVISMFEPIRDVKDCGIMRISIGDQNDLQLLPGHKYIFTIDFTNGVGFLGAKDPESPVEPILPGMLTAHVTMEEWLSTDFDRDSN